MIPAFRRDQRAFLLLFTGRCSAKSPHNRAGFVPQKDASVTSGISNAEGSAGFRLRFRDGRSASAPFPPSPRLRFTFPFAEPQAEASLCRRKTRAHAARTNGQTSRCRSSQICLPLSDFRRTITDMPKNALSGKK